MKKIIAAGLIGGCLAGIAGAAEDVPLIRFNSEALKDVQIRGRIQSQFGYVQAENDAVDESWNTAEIRRVRLGLRGTLFENVRAQLEANLVPGESLSMTSAYLEWREHKAAFIKLGLDMPPFGLEQTTSSAEILTVERSVLTQTFAPGELNGLSLSGTSGIFLYALGLFTDSKNTNSSNEPAKYMTNVSAELVLDKAVGQHLRLRGDYLQSEDANGAFGETWDQAFSGSLHFSTGVFDLRAEYISGEDLDETTTSGFSVMPSWRFTEKLEGVIRYEQVSSDNARGLQPQKRYVQRVPGLGEQTIEQAEGTTSTLNPAEGDEYSALYLGGNYYLAGHGHKLMFGVEFSELENTMAGTLEATTVYGAWRMLF